MRSCSHNDTYLLKIRLSVTQQQNGSTTSSKRHVKRQTCFQLRGLDPTRAEVQERKGWNIDLKTPAEAANLNLEAQVPFVWYNITVLKPLLGYTFLKFHLKKKVHRKLLPIVFSSALQNAPENPPAPQYPQAQHPLAAAHHHLSFWIPSPSSIWMRPISVWTSEFHSKWANLMALPSIHKLLTYPKDIPQKRSWNHHNSTMLLPKIGFLNIPPGPFQPCPACHAWHVA